MCTIVGVASDWENAKFGPSKQKLTPTTTILDDRLFGRITARKNSVARPKIQHHSTTKQDVPEADCEKSCQS